MCLMLSPSGVGGWSILIRWLGENHHKLVLFILGEGFPCNKRLVPLLWIPSCTALLSG